MIVKLLQYFYNCVRVALVKVPVHNEYVSLKHRGLVRVFDMTIFGPCLRYDHILIVRLSARRPTDQLHLV